MNRLVKASLLPAAFLAATITLRAQDVSGVINYEVTTRLGEGVAVRQMTIVSSGSGEATTVDMPDVITYKQTFTFNQVFGKLDSDRSGFGGMMTAMPAGTMARGERVMISSAGPATVTAAPAGRPSGNAAGQGFPQLPFKNTTYIDLSKKQFLQVLETTGDKKESWFSAEDFKIAADFKDADKTKKIAGYTCKKATVKLKDEVLTIWYTTEIPLTFSPINGIVPPGGGVVLSAESSKRSIEAKKIEMKPVSPADVMPPATAEKLGEKELGDKRRQLMEKFHNEQLQRQNQQ